jgi:hypothetical protein
MTINSLVCYDGMGSKLRGEEGGGRYVITVD